MGESSVKEKRQAAIEEYLAGNIDVDHDEELLKLFLLLSSNKDNSDELCERLFDNFGGIDNIIGSDVDRLLEIEGCNKNMAVLLSSIYSISNRIQENKNSSVKYLKTTDEQKHYFVNLLRLKREEVIVLITMDKNKKIINVHQTAKGSTNFAVTKTTDITKIILSDEPKYILLGHNHPSGDSQISAQDISFTINVCEWIESLNVKLLDHIVVGSNDVSSFAESGYKRYLSR